MIAARAYPLIAAVLLVAAAAPRPTPAQRTGASASTQAPSLVLRGVDGRERTVRPADLAHLTRREQTVSAHNVDGRYSGVLLSDVLALVNAPHPDSLRGPALATYVTIEASDGYRVVFSLAELSSEFNEHTVLLADRKDDQPLAASDGPYRIIVAGEKRPARWIRQVTRISVQRAGT